MTTAVDQIAELLTRLQSPDFYKREEAVRALGSYDADEAVAGLAMALEDDDMGIRELAADLLVQIKGDVASQLLVRFLGHADIGTRNLAAEVLVKLGADAVPALLSEIDNPDHDIRKFIVDVLGLIKAEAAIEPLCRKLWDDNGNVACSAAEALGEIGSNRAVSALIGAFENVEDARLQAAEALGKIGDPAALDKLYEFVETDDPVLKFAVLDAIGNIGQPQSVPRLMPILQTGDRAIAETALMAVINISFKNQDAVDCNLPLDQFREFLFENVKNGNRKITDFTLDRLTEWHGNEVLSSLFDVLDSVDDDDRERIVDALITIGPDSMAATLDQFASVSTAAKLTILEALRHAVNEKVARRLLPFVDDPEPDVRQRIAHLLGVSGWDGAKATLRQLAVDTVGHVRSAGYAALGWLADESDIDCLFEGLDDPYGDVRQAALGALIVVGTPRVVSQLSRDLYHDNVERQRLAASALGMIGDADVVGPLLGALNHPDASVRKVAVSSLGRIKAIADPQPLVLALSDENSSVRKAAVTALVQVKGQTAVGDIRALLDDSDVWVRFHTINAIGDLGVESNAEYIMPLLEADEDIVRIAAVKALARMDCHDAVGPMRRLCNDKNDDVVQAVEAAVSELEGTV